MSFLKSSTSFTRFRISDPVPAQLWGEVVERLRKNSFIDIDELPELRSFGWVSFEDMLNPAFNENPVEKGHFLAFSLRLDTRRVPPAVLKKHLSLAVRKEEALAREQGRKFVSRERKKELRELVELQLNKRFLPIPAEFQVVWNTGTGMVYFTSTQQKMLDMFQDLFTRTFELHLEPYTPYEAAARILGDAARLDSLEPTNFA